MKELLKVLFEIKSDGLIESVSILIIVEIIKILYILYFIFTTTIFLPSKLILLVLIFNCNHDEELIVCDHNRFK